MSSLRSDVSFSLRVLATQPGFAVAGANGGSHTAHALLELRFQLAVSRGRYHLLR